MQYPLTVRYSTSDGSLFLSDRHSVLIGTFSPPIPLVDIFIITRQCRGRFKEM